MWSIALIFSRWPAVDTTKEEAQIDQLIYGLYDLNTKEIEIVEHHDGCIIPTTEKHNSLTANFLSPEQQKLCKRLDERSRIDSGYLGKNDLPTMR